MPQDKKNKRESPLIERSHQEKKEVGEYEFTPEEREQYGRILGRITAARGLRETPRDEFDGMSYEQVYLSNKRAAMSFLMPKKNDDEVRVNTGTTEKRIESVLNELLGMNLEEDVETYDKDDNLLMDTSEIFTDIVRRTEQMERARDKDITIYQELLTQPSVFVEELWTKERIANGSKKGFRTRQKCERRLIQGVQMYLGDMFLPDTRFREQPYLIKYARMNKLEGELLFKELDEEKWKSVKPGSYISLGGVDTQLYRPGSLTGNEIEAFWYMSYPDNELQIMVQGIPFLEPGTRYTDHFGELGDYHITMVSLKPYGGDFSYGKPLTQSAKTLQALDNETIRNLIRKFRQALEPPLGTPSGKMFSRDIWTAGSITQGIKKSDFEKLIDHGGVTRSEMTMFDLIEKKINEFVGTDQISSLQSKTRTTATEHVAAQKAAVKMLGLSVLACMRLKERLALLRVRNVLANYTKPVGKEMDPVTGKIKSVYARFSVGGADVNGSQGSRVIQFADQGLDEDQQQMLYDHEEQMRKQGKNIEYKVVNVKKLRDLDLYFYVNVTAKPRESTEIDKAMIQEKINQATAITNITGRKMNANKLISSFERAWKEKDLFEKEAPQSLGQMQQQGQPGQDRGGGGGGMGKSVKDMTNNNMMNRVPDVGASMG